jgi:hypothetical protein
MVSQHRKRFLKQQQQAWLDRIAQAEAFVAEMQDSGAPLWIMAKAQLMLTQARGPQPGVRCRATAKGTGRQCRNAAEPNHWVCKYHGGHSTGAKTSAGRRRSLSALQAGHRRWRDSQGKGQG